MFHYFLECKKIGIIETMSTKWANVFMYSILLSTIIIFIMYSIMKILQQTNSIISQIIKSLYAFNVSKQEEETAIKIIIVKKKKTF